MVRKIIAKAGNVFKAVILGPPGAGKTTIAKTLSKTYNLVHVSSSERVWSHIFRGTPQGAELKEFVENKLTIPDDLMTKFMLYEWKHHFGMCPWILEGYPRNEDQAKEFWEHTKLNMVINLVVEDPVLHERFVTMEENDKNNLFKTELQRITVRKLLNQLDMQKPTARAMNDFYSEMLVLHNFPGSTPEEMLPSVKGVINDQIDIFNNESALQQFYA